MGDKIYRKREGTIDLINTVHDLKPSFSSWLVAQFRVNICIFFYRYCIISQKFTT